MVKLVVLANLLAIDFCFQFFFVVFIEKKKEGSYLTYFIHFF